MELFELQPALISLAFQELRHTLPRNNLGTRSKENIQHLPSISHLKSFRKWYKELFIYFASFFFKYYKLRPVVYLSLEYG